MLNTYIENIDDDLNPTFTHAHYETHMEKTMYIF